MVNRALFDSDGVEAVYRAGRESYRVTVLKTRPVFRADGQEVLLEWRGVDLLIRVEELPIEPARGHLVRIVAAGVKTVFEVLNPEGQPCFLMEAQGTRYRIHAKEVSEPET